MVDAKTKAMLFNKIAAEVDQDGYYRREATRLAEMEKYWHEPATRKYIVAKEEQLVAEREATIRGLVEYEIAKMEGN